MQTHAAAPVISGLSQLAGEILQVVAHQRSQLAFFWPKFGVLAVHTPPAATFFDGAALGAIIG